MRALIQRVSEARVEVAGEVVGEIGPGLLVLVCAMRGDGDEEARLLARKVAALRIFEDDAGKMNLSVGAVGGAALVVSQFTLSADTRRGNRPGFSAAAAPDEGERLYELFSTCIVGSRGAGSEWPFRRRDAGASRQRRPGHDLARYRSLSDQVPSSRRRASRSGSAARSTTTSWPGASVSSSTISAGKPGASRRSPHASSRRRTMLGDHSREP